MRICIVGNPEDLTLAYVAWKARRRGLAVLLLDERRFGVDWTFGFDEANVTGGAISFQGRRVSLTEIDAAYARLESSPTVEPAIDLDPADLSLLVCERRCAIQALLESLPCPVANRPSAGRSNGSKPHHYRRLADAGLHVPRWAVCNTRSALEEVVGSFDHGAIVKSCAGLRGRVRRVDGELLRRMDEGTTPVVVQEYIPGIEVRLHLVGGSPLATEVASDVIDYRYAKDTPPQRPTSAPASLVERCDAFARAEGLTITGFDFRVDAMGEWYCLEANPVPTFLPFEVATGQPIADVLLDTLCGEAS